MASFELKLSGDVNEVDFARIINALSTIAPSVNLTSEAPKPQPVPLKAEPKLEATPEVLKPEVKAKESPKPAAAVPPKVEPKKKAPPALAPKVEVAPEPDFEELEDEDIEEPVDEPEDEDVEEPVDEPEEEEPAPAAKRGRGRPPKDPPAAAAPKTTPVAAAAPINGITKEELTRLAREVYSALTAKLGQEAAMAKVTGVFKALGVPNIGGISAANYAKAATMFRKILLDKAA